MIVAAIRNYTKLSLLLSKYVEPTDIACGLLQNMSLLDNERITKKCVRSVSIDNRRESDLVSRI